MARKFERQSKSDITTSIGFIGVVLFFIGSACVSYFNIQVLSRDTNLVVRTHQVMNALDELLSTMKDAETGQRGYLLTGKDEYLTPYDGALTTLDLRIETLQGLTELNSAQQKRLPDMKLHIHNKMAELARTIELRRDKNLAAALSVVLSDRGKSEMDSLREEARLTRDEETLIRDQRLDEMHSAYETAILSGLLSGLLGVLLAWGVAVLVQRASKLRRRQQWLQSGQVGLGTAMFGDQRVIQLSEAILKYLSEYLDAQVGALYAIDGGDYRRAASYGLPEGSAPERISSGDGLIGQAIKDCRTFLIHNFPDGYLTVASSLGRSKPNHLLISPAIADGTVNAILELGFLSPVDDLTLELLDRVQNSVGIAVRSAIDRTRMQDLLEETQRQGEELQTQSEELRVSNEELEEQGRALKDSQSRLEEQQAELEQTNSQLEEQTQILEMQRNDLTDAKAELEMKASDLERTSRYKSDFLANMSHELRTPLNSSLILAKLLGDNREGNLTDEQVKYAQTIQSAGNDLLSLISEILDLSKIEAGHMEVQVQPLRIDDLVASLRRTFEPVAGQKSLNFKTEVSPDAPQLIETDGQRLEQILKNLLSNAIKFTDKGEVTLDVHPAEGGMMAFSVSDSGIGIAPHQQEMVFEAFRQADGTTNRKFGGTGLGLSISRELAHLLGGEVTLESEPGKGSTFTVTASTHLAKGSTKPEPPPPPIKSRPAPPRREPASLPPQGANRTSDDRNSLSPGSRLILVVEDDEKFARIIYDLAHEQGFNCLIAASAEAGLALAAEYLPSAVVLDIGLPDHSGLSVLDRLKHDGRTRHIPVHIVSGGDYSKTAMSWGAVSYMLKPVKREELVEAFEGIEERLTQKLRRVLVVEDDEVQLDSLRLLLGSRDVETLGARSVAACLELLRTTTFDCMVLDLSLPDASGFSLLETLSREEAYAFPPVIVYTGRDLSQEEEQQLRRYSQSIIVKGAKSPERLLDEVTLFLHQVVADLPMEKQKLIEKAKHRDAALENRMILIVEDDIRNIFALTSILEPRGARVEIARNGREALEVLERLSNNPRHPVDLVLMDIMMPEMDGFTAMREIRKRPEWKKLPIIALTAKAMKDDQEQCLAAGANDYVAKPLDVEKLLSLMRVWMPRD